MVINFIKVENTGKTISQWDDSDIGVYYKEKVYDGGIKSNVVNNELTISSNNIEIIFKDYDYTKIYKMLYMGNAIDRIYNIQDQIKQGKITVEKAVIEKAEKMFKFDNDKEKDLEENDENTEEIQEDFSNDFYDDVE